MMKCIFVVVLLQVCYCLPTKMTPTSYTPDFNLNNEILNELGKLNTHIDLTMPKLIPIPGEYMLNNTAQCVDVFSRVLRRFLGNLTQDKPVQPIIKRLDSKLALLANHLQKNSKCRMTRETPKKKNSFTIYIDFIKKLNTSR